MALATTTTERGIGPVVSSAAAETTTSGIPVEDGTSIRQAMPAPVGTTEDTAAAPQQQPTAPPTADVEMHPDSQSKRCNSHS